MTIDDTLQDQDLLAVIEDECDVFINGNWSDLVERLHEMWNFAVVEDDLPGVATLSPQELYVNRLLAIWQVGYVTGAVAERLKEREV